MKNNIGLVEHAKKALTEKWGYVWGTFGMILTQNLFLDKLAQYPTGVGQYRDFIQSNYINKRTSDCVGLIKSYLWWEVDNPKYDPKTDLSANGMYQKATEKGHLKTIPEIPGLLVWKDGHIGIYICNGQVLEARGTKAGVIQSPLTGAGSAGWTHWCKCPFISYKPEKHFAEDHFAYLKKSGIIIHEKRFDDPIKRGELFALLAQILPKERMNNNE